jgi:hypothetical protein
VVRLGWTATVLFGVVYIATVHVRTRNILANHWYRLQDKWLGVLVLAISGCVGSELVYFAVDAVFDRLAPQQSVAAARTKTPSSLPSAPELADEVIKRLPKQDPHPSAARAIPNEPKQKPFIEVDPNVNPIPEVDWVPLSAQLHGSDEIMHGPIKIVIAPATTIHDNPLSRYTGTGAYAEEFVSFPPGMFFVLRTKLPPPPLGAVSTYEIQVFSPNDYTRQTLRIRRFDASGLPPSHIAIRIGLRYEYQSEIRRRSKLLLSKLEWDK